MPSPETSIPQDAETEFEAQAELMNKGESPLERGLSFDAISLQNVRSIERSEDSPGLLMDDNWPWRSWGGLAEVFVDMARSAYSDHMRYVYITCGEFARSFFRHKVKSMNPMRAQFDLFDLQRAKMANMRVDPMADPYRQVVEDTQRVFREQCYLFFNREFLGRR